MKYFFSGMVLAFLLLKGDIASWYRMQELFLFGSWHLFGSILLAGIVYVTYLYFTGILRNALSIKFSFKPEWGDFKFAVCGLMIGAGVAMTGFIPSSLLALTGGGFIVPAILLVSVASGSYVCGALNDTGNSDQISPGSEF